MTPLQRSYKLYDAVYVASGMEGVFVGVTSTANSGDTASVDNLVKAGEAQYRKYLLQEGDAVVAGDVNGTRRSNSTPRPASMMRASS